MAKENYKKWVLIAIFLFLAVTTLVSMETSDYKKKPQVRSSGPVVKADTAKEFAELPDDAAALSVIGDKYFEDNKFAEAIEAYEKAVKLSPDDVDTYNDLGLAYHYTGRSDIAIDRLKKGAEAGPSYQRIWLTLGYVLISTGRSSEADAALEKALELGPESEIGKEAARLKALIKQ